MQFFENKTVRGYLSSSTPIPHFGLGKTQIVDSLKVRWTDGRETQLTNIQSNQSIKVSYQASKEVTTPIFNLKSADKIFREVTQTDLKPGFVHRENNYSDYGDQKLLPHQFSKSGPFVSVGDFNGDGSTDILLENTATGQDWSNSPWGEIRRTR